MAGGGGPAGAGGGHGGGPPGLPLLLPRTLAGGVGALTRMAEVVGAAGGRPGELDVGMLLVALAGARGAR